MIASWDDFFCLCNCVCYCYCYLGLNLLLWLPDGYLLEHLRKLNLDA